MFLELFRWLQWHWHSYNSAETAQFTCWHREWNLLFIFLLEQNHIRNCFDVLTKNCVNSTITYLIAFFAFVLLENKFYWISKYAAVKSLEYNQCFFLTNTYIETPYIKTFCIQKLWLCKYIQYVLTTPDVLENIFHYVHIRWSRWIERQTA